MKTTHHEFSLEKAGFEIAGPDVWGKVLGGVTAFIEMDDAHATAWLWDAENEQHAGPVLRFEGSPVDTVDMAIAHLEALLSEEQTSPLPRAITPTEEKYGYPD